MQAIDTRGDDVGAHACFPREEVEDLAFLIGCSLDQRGDEGIGDMIAREVGGVGEGGDVCAAEALAEARTITRGSRGGDG